MGVRESNFQFGMGKSFLLPITSAALAVLALLLLVWVIEYSFIGRFAIVKILFSTGLSSFISSILISIFFRGNPTKGLLLLSAKRKRAIIEGTKGQSQSFHWVELGDKLFDKEANIQKICEENNIDLLVIDDEFTARSFDIINILGSDASHWTA